MGQDLAATDLRVTNRDVPLSSNIMHLALGLVIDATTKKIIKQARRLGPLDSTMLSLIVQVDLVICS